MKAEQRLFEARYTKSLIEIADLFLSRKDLMDEKDIEELEKKKQVLIDRLKDYKIYNIH